MPGVYLKNHFTVNGLAASDAGRRCAVTTARLKKKTCLYTSRFSCCLLMCDNYFMKTQTRVKTSGLISLGCLSHEPHQRDRHHITTTLMYV